MFLLIFYLLLAVITSFVCSISESVLLTSPVTYLKLKASEGSIAAARMLDLKKDIDKPLSAILSLNTIAHTVGAAGVGAQATLVFGEQYFGLVSALMTLIILVLTEIIPKTIGSLYWSKIIPPTVSTIRFMMVITYPLIILSKFITQLFMRNVPEVKVSREEISLLTQIGTEEGVFAENQNKIIQNIIRLKNIRVMDVMTPRVVMTIVPAEMTLNEFQRNKELLRFSRIPVFEDDHENITGYVFRQTVFEKLAEHGGNSTVKDIEREIVILHATQPLLLAWEALLEKMEHIALVVDEYGSVDGLVTMEDIIESLLGLEIMDEKDDITDMQQYARERWKMRQVKYDYIDTEPTEDTPITNETE